MRERFHHMAHDGRHGSGIGRVFREFKGRGFVDEFVGKARRVDAVGEHLVNLPRLHGLDGIAGQRGNGGSHTLQ